MSSSSSLEECQATFGRSVRIFHSIVFASLLLTLARLVWIKKAPGTLRDKARKHGLVLGPCKIVLGILLYTVLYPTCPAGGCDCNFSSAYPLIAIGIGCYWVVDGTMARKRLLLQETNNPNSTTEGSGIARIQEEHEDTSCSSHQEVEAKVIV